MRHYGGIFSKKATGSILAMEAEYLEPTVATLHFTEFLLAYPISPAAIFDTTLFVLFSAAIAVVDIKTGMVPRVVFVIAFPVFLGLCLLRAELYTLAVILPGTLLGLVIFGLAFILSGKKLGLADVWYSGLIGLVLGPLWWYPAIGIACLMGTAWSLLFKKRRIPFIPCMAVGSITISVVQGWFL